MSTREERKARADARADRAASRATAAADAVDNHHARQIPLGQPILVGHHSEARHRKTIASFEATIGKSVQASRAAEEQADRARNAGYAIQVGDDDAVSALRDKLNKAEAEHAQYVAHNKETRKGTHTITVLGCSGCKELNRPRIGYHPSQQLPSYVLNNSRGRIKQVKQQLAKAERTAQAKAEAAATGEQAPELAAGDGWQITNDITDDRVRITFDGKPDAATRSWLKERGWRWSPHAAAWQRQNTPNGLYGAKLAARYLAGDQ